LLGPSELVALRALSLADTLSYYDDLEAAGRKQGKIAQVVRMMCLLDLYYLLVRACKRSDMVNEFAFARCREVEASPDGHLDLWAREHFKSSVITFGLTIQDILKDPEVTFGLFSHTRPIAKAFLRQIMREFEENETLHVAFPDVLWGKDIRSAPKWSEDDGIIVKRKSNPKEATIEAWGLVDGQPTSKHYKKLLYDDVVVRETVTTPEQIEKTMTALEQSYNLGVTPGGVRRMAGTRWHYHDPHRTVIDRGTFKPREHPGKKGGTEDGESVYWPEEVHLEKRRDMGPYTYAAQILLNPKADGMQGFGREWIRKYKKMPSVAKMNGYILVDAASSKKKGSDYTSMWVVGLNVDRNRYALDIVRDRLNLKERSNRLFELHRKWTEAGLKILQVRYERYGMLSDIEHMQSRMEDENYRFTITEVAGQTSKHDRIKRLVPIFEQGQFWLPESFNVTDWQRTTVDLVRSFIEEEFLAFPVGLHDDMMDSLARMEEPDLKLVWPKAEKPVEYVPPPVRANAGVAWMGA
jgi:predicted phage terminase large subunit-like protein